MLFRWKGASECWRSSRPAAWRVYWTLSGVYSPHKHIKTTSTAKQALNELHPFTPAGTRPNIWTMRLPPSRSKTCCSKINPTWNWKAAGRSQCLVRISKELLNKPLSNISVIIVLNCHFEKKLFLLLRIFFKKKGKKDINQEQLVKYELDSHSRHVWFTGHLVGISSSTADLMS